MDNSQDLDGVLETVHDDILPNGQEPNRLLNPILPCMPQPREVPQQVKRFEELLLQGIRSGQVLGGDMDPDLIQVVLRRRG